MSAIDEIEGKAAAKAIYGTVRMLEETFGVRAKGSTPKAKRESVIRELERKFDKLRKGAKRRGLGPNASELVSAIAKAAASRQGLRLDAEKVQRLAKVMTPRRTVT